MEHAVTSVGQGAEHSTASLKLGTQGTAPLAGDGDTLAIEAVHDIILDHLFSDVPD